MLFNKIVKVIMLIGIAIGISSCSSENAESLFSPDDDIEASASEIAARAIYDDELSAIIDDKCISCHTGFHSNGANRYDTYESTIAIIPEIINRVNSTGRDIMPIASAPPLTEEELEVFNEFFDTLSN